MCFSVNVNLVKEELENRYGASFLDPDRYSPSYYYHAFGLPELPAICSGSLDKIRMLRWGLIPSWVKNRSYAEEIRFKTFNARSESIDTKPSFSGSFDSKRCIIPVKGFFEWQHIGTKKIPWHISFQNDEIISLAGLWDEWVESSTGEIFPTFTIVTTDANDLMAEIHNTKKRMPVILDKEGERQWVGFELNRKDTLGLLRPCPSQILRATSLKNHPGSHRDSPQ